MGDILPVPARAVASRPARERVGVWSSSGHAGTDLAAIAAAEAAGVRQFWVGHGPQTPDPLITFAAAAARTSHIRLGTAIVPVYPRHPLMLAQQALALGEMFPNRLRLGIGTSDIETMAPYGLAMPAPLSYVREYLIVLRALLWEGTADFHGRFFEVAAAIERPPHTPLLLAALGPGTFRLAGELADGAISWLCPLPYLRDIALPALRAGAAQANRSAPPLIAHIPVVLSQDRSTMLAVARRALREIVPNPYFARMYHAAGFALEPRGHEDAVPEPLIDQLVVWGDAEQVSARLLSLLDSGLDEIMVTTLTVADEATEHADLMRLIGQI